MKVRLVHEASEQTWETAARPTSNLQRIRLQGTNGEFLLFIEGDAGEDPFRTLTPRQKVVAVLATRGLTTKAIAAELGIGNETIRTHLKTIYLKLGVAGRTELTRLAIGGLVFLDEEMP